MPSGNKIKRKKTAPKKSPAKKSGLSDTLDQIGDESVADAKQEFQELLAKAKGDSTGFIQENAQELEERLLEVRDKKLDREDFGYFVERQKRSLQLFIDSQPPQAQERAEKLTISLLEMAAKKIVPLLIAMI